MSPSLRNGQYDLEFEDPFRVLTCDTLGLIVWQRVDDLIASHVDIILMELASATKLHKLGRARILTVATEKRITSLPDISTVSEVAAKNFDSRAWNAIVAPPKMPTAIVARLNKAIDEVLKSPRAQAHFAKFHLQAAGGTPTEAAAFIRRETEVWGDVIKEAHVPAH